MWFQVELYLPMRAMYILINRGKQGATMSRKKKVSIPCSHIVKLLIEKGADVNTLGGEYGSALYAASNEGHEAIEKMLINNGVLTV